MKKVKTFCSIIKYFDLFGVPIELCFNQKLKYKSFLGAAISISVLIFSLHFFFSRIISWYKIDNSTTIYSTENFSFQSLLNDNRSIEYTWDNTNYNIYFVVRGEIPTPSGDPKILVNEELSKYLKINFKYTEDADIMGGYQTIEKEYCKISESNQFLMLNYDRQENSENLTNANRLCVKNPYTMGLKTDLKMQNVKRPGISFQIRQCENSTSDLMCASKEEISKIMKNLFVQASIPLTLYDFKNKSQPIKRMFKYEFFRLDWDMTKKITYDVSPTFLYKDLGFFEENYNFESVNFNPNQPTIDMNTKNLDDIFFQYDLRISLQAEKYYIKNEKLNDIIGSFGGMISILYTIGNFFCLHLNRFLLTKDLIKSSFRLNNSEKMSKKKKKTKSKFG